MQIKRICRFILYQTIRLQYYFSFVKLFFDLYSTQFSALKLLRTFKSYFKKTDCARVCDKLTAYIIFCWFIQYSCSKCQRLYNVGMTKWQRLGYFIFLPHNFTRIMLKESRRQICHMYAQCVTKPRAKYQKLN